MLRRSPSRFRRRPTAVQPWRSLRGAPTSIIAGDAHSSLLIKRYTAIRIPNPTYIPTNATSISIATPELIIFAADRKIIVPARPVNEMTMPATTFSALFLGIGYAGFLDALLCLTFLPHYGPKPQLLRVRGCRVCRTSGWQCGTFGVAPFQWTVERLGHKRLSTGC